MDTHVRTTGDPWNMGVALTDAGQRAMVQEAYGVAQARFEEALSLWRKVGNRLSIAGALNALGWMPCGRGRMAWHRPILRKA